MHENVEGSIDRSTDINKTLDNNQQCYMKQVSMEVLSMGSAVDGPGFTLITQALDKLLKHSKLLIPHL